MDDPVTIDRFVVLARVGAGAAGDVYAAYDPRLERKVAIKLLRHTVATGVDPNDARQRMLREAQTLAQLSHPNVVRVHETGEFDGKVFIAMAFVDGQNLRQWLAFAPRAWPEVLTKLLAAGRGLAAAHDAGLVHRDFKPDNVLVDRNGGVHVADFGLARPVAPDAGDRPQAPGPTPSKPLTETGLVVGTPAYMAPEQYAGLPFTARADQFSFCVALFEGLYGQRPFVGDSAASLALAIASGAVQPCPPGSRVPGWIRRAVVRGLDPQPERRWQDMHALLAALANDPARAWRRTGAVGAALTVGTAGLAVWFAGPWGAAPCAGLRDPLHGTWDAARRDEVRQALLRSEHPSAARTWVRVDGSLSRFAEAWISARTDACQATRVQGAASEATLDRRVQCLERARFALRAATQRLVQPDAKIIANADRILPIPSMIDRCDAQTVLETGTAPPTDPQARQRIAALDAELAQVATLRLAGHLQQAGPRARAATLAATTLGYAPTLARAWVEEGMGLADVRKVAEARDAFAAAVVAAERGRADITRTIALLRLAERLTDLGELGEARRTVDQAEAAQSRFLAEGDRASLSITRARIAVAEGKRDEARAALGQSLHGRDGRTHGSPSADAEVVAQWATVALEAGVPGPQIEARLQDAVSVATAARGPVHPDIATLSLALANVRLHQGDKPGARTAVQAALSIRRTLGGADDPSLTDALLTHGVVAYRSGQYDEALARYQQAIATIERTAGPESLDLAAPLHNTALVLHRLGQLDEAIAFDQRALSIRQLVLGDSHAKTADAHAELALTYFRAGQLAAAARHYTAAAHGHRTAHAQASVVQDSVGLAETLCALERCGEARSALEEARAYAIESGLSDAVAGRVEFALARALQADGEPEQALALAHSAQRRLDADATADPDSRAAVQAWLALQ